jgi:hypothetical protein
MSIRSFQLKILAFITDFATARAIRRSLKLPAQEPEPLAHGPPHEIEMRFPARTPGEASTRSSPPTSTGRQNPAQQARSLNFEATNYPKPNRSGGVSKSDLLSS